MEQAGTPGARQGLAAFGDLGIVVEVAASIVGRRHRFYDGVEALLATEGDPRTESVLTFSPPRPNLRYVISAM